MSNNASAQSNHPKYRSDIDGLRAIAVLAVVAFHAFPEFVKGGFVGVDVFFVISGYLISTILFKSLESNSFSFQDFYVRRIRRIFPALTLVLSFCLVVGWCGLLAGEYRELGKHIAAGTSFLSNFVLWKESGYFDVAADTKPLLHLWSLGIEEQFYIVWPLLLWLAWRRKLNLLTLTILLAMASYGLNITSIKVNPTASFYSPLTRFWQLLCGSLLAWLTLYRAPFFSKLKLQLERFLLQAIFREPVVLDGQLVSHLLSLLGLALIFNAIYRLNSSFPFPGKWALLPTLGAVLLIAANTEAWVNRRVLSQRWLIWIGKISYPLYLWHWPLLSFARIFKSTSPSLTMRFVIVSLSVVLAWLTCHLIEKPLRFGKYSRIKTTSLVSLMLLQGLAGYAIFDRAGLKYREVVKTNVDKESAQDGGDLGQTIQECGIQDPTEKALFYGCRTDKRETPRFALWGDSKAGAVVDGIYRTSQEGGRWLYIGGNGPSAGTVPVISQAEVFRVYQGVAKIALRTIAENKDVERVLLVAATRALFQLNTDRDIEGLPSSKLFDTALDGLDNTVSALIKFGKKVVLLVDNPTLAYPEDCLSRKTTLPLIQHLFDKENLRCSITLDRHLILSEKYRRLLEAVRTRHPDDVKIFDTLNYLCDTSKRVCSSFKDGRLLYVYTDHISDYAAGMIGRDLNQLMLARW